MLALKLNGVSLKSAKAFEITPSFDRIARRMVSMIWVVRCSCARVLKVIGTMLGSEILGLKLVSQPYFHIQNS